MLPKIDYPIHNITIPSTKKKMKFRPFLVKEEKILLMAKESGDPADYLLSIKQVINNCCLEKGFVIDTLTTFDIEYIFLKLRAISIDNIVKMSFIDHEDNKNYDFEIDLNKIEVVFPDKIDNNIKITDNIGILMKYPTAELFSDKKFINESKEPLFDMIVKCIDKIYEGDTIYDAKHYKTQEIINFLENLDIKTFEMITKFLDNMPKLYHVINYINENGNDRKIEFKSLSDFFP